MCGRYGRLAAVLTVNVVVLFLASYALMDSFGHFHPTFSPTYHAVMTVAPVIAIILLAVRALYANTALNKALMVAFAALSVVNFTLARTQMPPEVAAFAAVPPAVQGDAAVTCTRASMAEPALADLCDRLVHSQRRARGERQAMVMSSQEVGQSAR